MVNAHGLHWHRSSRDVNLRTSTHGRGFDSPGRLPVGEPGDVAVESRCVIEAASPSGYPRQSTQIRRCKDVRKKGYLRVHAEAPGVRATTGWHL